MYRNTSGMSTLWSRSPAPSPPDPPTALPVYGEMKPEKRRPPAAFLQPPRSLFCQPGGTRSRTEGGRRWSGAFSGLSPVMIQVHFCRTRSGSLTSPGDGSTVAPQLQETLVRDVFRDVSPPLSPPSTEELRTCAEYIYIMLYSTNL